MARKLDNYLRTHRKKSGLHQHEIAYLLGANTGTQVSRYELSTREPSAKTIFALEVIFNTTARELFAGIYGRVERRTRKRALHLAARLSERAQDRAISHKLAALRGISGDTTPSRKA